MKELNEKIHFFVTSCLFGKQNCSNNGQLTAIREKGGLMNRISSLPEMKLYLRYTNVIAILMALVVGLITGLQDSLKEILDDKYEYITLLSGIFSFFYTLTEYGASRILKSKGIGLCISILGNPLLGRSVFQLMVLVGGGWLITERYQLSSLLSYVALPVLVACFVGGIFESFRLLKRSV